MTAYELGLCLAKRSAWGQMAQPTPFMAPMMQPQQTQQRKPTPGQRASQQPAKSGAGFSAGQIKQPQPKPVQQMQAAPRIPQAPQPPMQQPAMPQPQAPMPTGMKQAATSRRPVAAWNHPTVLNLPAATGVKNPIVQKARTAQTTAVNLPMQNPAVSPHTSEQTIPPDMAATVLERRGHPGTRTHVLPSVPGDREETRWEALKKAPGWGLTAMKFGAPLAAYLGYQDTDWDRTGGAAAGLVLGGLGSFGLGALGRYALRGRVPTMLTPRYRY